MKNIITDLLHLTDEDSTITSFSTAGTTHYITLEKILKPKFCPVCGGRLHSKGTFKRHPNNPILQDGYTLDITLIGRRWFCPAQNCDYTETDQFSFLDPNKKNTKIVPIRIVYEMKDLNLTCRQIARRYNVSDTYVHDTFMQYVSMKRKPLTEIISIDEVYLNISAERKYALVIMDFVTGDILDILPSRRKEVTEEYFRRIPLEERNRVKTLVCDMYNPYINYTVKYFRNSSAVVDSFHVIQWLNNQINQYINYVKRKYQERDRALLKEENLRTNKEIEKKKDSREVYILKKAPWVLLSRSDNINYSRERTYNRFLGQYLDTYDWINMFNSLDPLFPEIRKYKDLYEEFNRSYINDHKGASIRLQELIEIYRNCNIPAFFNFANLLRKYSEQIINSFTYITVCESGRHTNVLRRISNGPMESFNNNPSSLRSRSHGLANFEFARNRIIYSLREDAALLLVPKTKKEIKVNTGKKRGKYHK